MVIKIHFPFFKFMAKNNKQEIQRLSTFLSFSHLMFHAFSN